MKIMKEIEKKQRGFTLIEFMVVIALIGLGLVLVVTQFGQANEANRTSTAIKNITSLAGGISSFKGTRTGYQGSRQADFWLPTLYLTICLEQPTRSPTCLVAL